LGDLLRAIGHPIIEFATATAPRRHPVCRSETRIELYRFVEQRQSLVHCLPGSLMKVRHSAEIVVVGVEAFGWLPLRALDLCPLQLRCDRADDVFGYLVLQLEDVPEGGFETVCPEVPPGRRVEELSRDAHAFCRFAYAALQHVAYAQLAAHLLYVYCPTLVGEARVARDDEQPAYARQRRDDVLHHAVGEVVLFRVSAQVLERQGGNGGFVGKGQRMCRCFIRFSGLSLRGTETIR